MVGVFAGVATLFPSCNILYPVSPVFRIHNRSGRSWSTIVSDSHCWDTHLQFACKLSKISVSLKPNSTRCLQPHWAILINTPGDVLNQWMETIRVTRISKVWTVGNHHFSAHHWWTSTLIQCNISILDHYNFGSLNHIHAYIIIHAKIIHQ